MSKRIHTVTLPEEERTFLHTYIMTGVRSARSIKRALILLDSDRNRSDPWIAEHQKVSKATVYNIRRRYCSEGLQATLHDKPRSGAPKKLTVERKHGSRRLSVQTLLRDVNAGLSGSLQIG